MNGATINPTTKRLEILPLTASQTKNLCNRRLSGVPLSNGEMLRIFETAYRGALDDPERVPGIGSKEWADAQGKPCSP